MEIAYKCSVCLLSYNEHRRRPLVLPCSHSYCQECLQQLDTIKNKLCPSCSDSWQHVEVADLLLCRQLLPGQKSLLTSERSNLCIPHGVCMLLWCETCNMPLCLKCLKHSHVKCQCRLIKDKTTELQKRCSNALQKFKRTIQTIEENTNKIVHDLNVLNILHEDLNKLKTDTGSHKQQYDSWKMDMKQELLLLEGCDAASVLHDCNIPSLKQRFSKMETPKKPATLLTFITHAYAATKYKSKEGTISDFMECLDVVYKSAMTRPASDAAGELAGEPKLPELQEGQQWTLCDASSAIKAIATLINTSVRPSAVIFKRLVSWPTEVVEELFELLSRLECQLKMFMMDNLAYSSENSSGTDSAGRGGTGDGSSSWGTAKQVIQLYNKNFQEIPKQGMMELVLYERARRPISVAVTPRSHSCSLVEVWGHLDADTVKMLPVTIRRIGLVLVSFADVTAVCALGRFPNLGAVDLFVTQTFSTERWALSSASVGTSDATDTTQTPLGSVSMHFSDIDSTYLRWMVNVIEKMTILFRSFSYVLHLYLPGTTLPPDAVLGVVRDCCCISSVCLPPGLAPGNRKVELEKKFKVHNCYIVWNTEYGLPLQINTPTGIEYI